MHPRRLVLALVALSALAFAPACHRKNSSASIGTCNDQSNQCGVQISREGDPPRELKCTPPDTKLPMACDCMESGQSKKKVLISTKLPGDLDAAERLARDNCGW